MIYNISLCSSVHTIKEVDYVRPTLEKVWWCTASSAALLSHHEEGGTVLLSVGDWLLSVAQWAVIFLLRPVMVWVMMGKYQIPRLAADEVRERPTSTATIVDFIQKLSAMTWHVSCVVFWAHKIMSCMQSSSTPAQYWGFLKLIIYEPTDPWYSIRHLLFPLCYQFPCSVNWELSVLLQRTIYKCACVVVKAKITTTAERPLLSTGHQVIPTKKPPHIQRQKKNRDFT